MTRRQFCTQLMDRVGIERDLAEKVFDAFNDTILEIIATEDFITLPWARVEGYCREPRKIYGYYSQSDTARANHGWSWAKCGYPKVTLTKLAKDCTNVSPEEYFNEWVENKYTSKAREFRKDAGLPELEEFGYLTEKQIERVNKVADAKRYGKKTKKEQLEEAKYRQANARQSLVKAHLKKMAYIEKKVEEGMSREEAEKIPYSQIVKEEQREWRRRTVELQKKKEANGEAMRSDAYMMKQKLKVKELNVRDYRMMTQEEIDEWEKENGFDEEDLSAIEEFEAQKLDIKMRVLADYIKRNRDNKDTAELENNVELTEEELNKLLEELDDEVEITVDNMFDDDDEEEDDEDNEDDEDLDDNEYEDEDDDD